MNENIIEGVEIKRLQKFSDERGYLAEIYRKDEVDHQPAMSYFSVTKPGLVRGPHEHRKQTNCFAFVGPGDFRFYMWDNREGSATKGMEMRIRVGEHNPTLVRVPPGIVHGYKCISKKEAYCINFPDRLYRGENRAGELDEIRWDGEIDSPFRIV